MKSWHLSIFLIGLSFIVTSCASYRTVFLAKGTDQAGEIRSYYGVAENNVIIPEYVINERGEYPTVAKDAWHTFKSRKGDLSFKMHAKYIIPGNFGFTLSKSFLAVGFIVVSPITYPIYVASTGKGKRSFGRYFDVMVYGPSAKEPVLRDDLGNF